MWDSCYQPAWTVGERKSRRFGRDVARGFFMAVRSVCLDYVIIYLRIIGIAQS